MDEIQKALRERYPDVHPLVFHRCIEKAKTNGELFDLLDGLPEPPYVWDEERRTWVHVEDVIQKEAVHIAIEKGKKQEENKEKEDD